MQIKFCKIKMESVKSEKGFTLLELIFVIVVTGILSSTLILPFTSSIKNGTQPEIYATATYLAMSEIEKKRSEGYTYTALNNFGTSTSTVPMNVRSYDVQVVAGYVTHSGSSFSDPPVASPVSKFIKVTVTISNTNIPHDVELWTILVNDYYNPDANS
jgi:prepilin-type N-terminal cleavage/methylation domain-containing protein